MRPRLLALRAVGTAALCAAAPVLSGAATAAAAPADDGVTVTAGPVAAAAHGEARVTVEGCKGGRATVSSSAFARATTLTASRTEGGALYGDVSVKYPTAAGSYGISVACDGHDHGRAGRLRVVKGGQQQGHATPRAPVRAGGGGTADRPVAPGRTPRAPASRAQSGPGIPYTLTGLGLAAVAAVTVACRSSRRRHAAIAPTDRNLE